jgi:ATP-dependent helicase/nuclease subunit A
MTRARHALHLLVPPLRPTKQGVSSTGRTDLSFAAILRQALARDVQEGVDGGEVLFASGGPGWASPVPDQPPAEPVPPLSIRLAGTSAPTRSRPEQRPSDGGEGATVRAEDLLRRSDPGGRAFGTAMHAACEALCFVDEEGVPTADAVAAALRGAGVAFTDADTERYARQLARMLEAEPVAAVLSRDGAAELWRERAFAALVDGRLMRGVFDRVHLWRDAGGRPTRALLIDFKTDRPGDDGPAGLAERYRAQMAAYRGALSAMLGLDEGAIDAVLVLTGAAQVVPVG